MKMRRSTFLLLALALLAPLAARAQEKLVEVEAKIADLQIIAETLRSTVDAGCDDLVECAGNACCPIPFATISQAHP